MKRVFRRRAMTLAFLLVTCMTASAAVGDILATGSCGNNLTWTLTANGERPFDSQRKSQCDGLTMTISGTGNMANTAFSQIFYQALSNVYTNEELTFIMTKRISNVIIEEGVTSIGNQAFSDFKNMRRITLPSTLTSIGSNAFMNCDALKSVDIPDNVTSIGGGIFQECDSLRSVSLSAGIKTIPINTFKNCVRLMTLRLKRYEPTDANPITVFNRGDSNGTFSDKFAFYNCAALSTLIVPKAGMDTYQSSPCWQFYPFFKAKDHINNDVPIYFKYILRPDCDILFEAGATNRWTTWADKVNHAAPKGAEVYTIHNVGSSEVTLNRITARVTLPETMREGTGDDGVRDLVPAFVPVLIKRPDGTLTEDLTMPFVMGGDLIFENGWYFSSINNPCIWVKDKSGSYDNEADGYGYVPTVFPDVMANAPYGYSFGLSYILHPFGLSASGSAKGLTDPDHDTGIKDAVEGRTLDNSVLYGNADKNGLSACSSDLNGFGERTAYAFENDTFRPMTDEEKNGKLASHQCALLVSARTTYPEQLTLSINERTEVTLSDDADNTAAIAAAASNTTSNRVTLSGHTFYLDGDWNTLCLPFTINLLTEYKHRDQLFQFFGGNANDTGSQHDAIVMELDTEGDYGGHQTGFDATDGTLYLYFRRVYAIEAGKPYIVKWRFRTQYSISDPVFYDAAISAAAPTAITFPGGQFVGTYSPVSYNSTNTSILFLGAANTLYYPQPGANIGPFRAYFDLGASPSPSEGGGTGVRAFVLNFGDGNETESLSDAPRLNDKGEMINDKEAGAWYDLQGRKVNVQSSMFNVQSKKGLYIHNNRKVVIK